MIKNPTEITQIQLNVNETFNKAFGRTPLKERLDDILREAIELHRFSDINSLREETGDLLASTIQLANECKWDISNLIYENAQKINNRTQQYKSLGRKLRVGLVGGAFDPPTIGHIKLAQFVLNTSKEFDEIWFVPCNTHMHNKKMTKSDYRLEMCAIATEADPRIKTFPYEINNNLSGETYNFIKRLQEDPEYKDAYNFSIIIGLDNANSFDTWVNYELLERTARFVVVSRQGYNNNPNVNWYLKPPHIYLHTEEFIPETSSTEARRLLKNKYVGGRLTDLLDKNVITYIRENKLYL